MLYSPRPRDGRAIFLSPPCSQCRSPSLIIIDAETLLSRVVHSLQQSSGGKRGRKRHWLVRREKEIIQWRVPAVTSLNAFKLFNTHTHTLTLPLKMRMNYSFTPLPWGLQEMRCNQANHHSQFLQFASP